MRVAVFAAIAATALGFVGGSTVSGAPAYGSLVGAVSSSRDAKQDAYAVRRSYYTYHRYRRHRHCFQDCPERA